MFFRRVLWAREGWESWVIIVLSTAIVVPIASAVWDASGWFLGLLTAVAVGIAIGLAVAAVRKFVKPPPDWIPPRS